MDVRTFDVVNSPTELVNWTSMSYKRWYPTPTLLASNKVMIMGGTQVGESWCCSGDKTSECWRRTIMLQGAL